MTTVSGPAWDRQEARVMLHICCAPDATVPLEKFKEEGRQVEGFFYGSNIQPEEEYHRRLSALRILMKEHAGLAVLEAPYAPDKWLEHMKNLNLMDEPEGGRRCPECFRLQLEAAAEAGARRGCSRLCTSLTISPHKDVERIMNIGESVAAAYGLLWEPRVWRRQNGFLRSVRLSREMGLYRQNYCGCLPSLNKK